MTFFKTKTKQKKTPQNLQLSKPTTFKILFSWIVVIFIINFIFPLPLHDPAECSYFSFPENRHFLSCLPCFSWRGETTSAMKDYFHRMESKIIDKAFLVKYSSSWRTPFIKSWNNCHARFKELLSYCYHGLYHDISKHCLGSTGFGQPIPLSNPFCGISSFHFHKLL